MMPALLLGVALTGLVGISMGLLGGGGALFAAPILVYVLGVEPKAAIIMTLIIVGTISLLGALVHWRAKNLNIAKGLKFGLAMMPGSYLGAKVATLPFVTGTMQMILLAAVMLSAAGFMIYRSFTGPLPDNEVIDFYPKPLCTRCGLWMATEGFGVGLLTGLVGVGGGFAIVPALVLLGDTPVREAIATSLMIIAISSIAALAGYLGHVELDVTLVVMLTAGAAARTLAGLACSKFLRSTQLQKGFSYLLVAMGVFILFQNRAVFGS